MMRDSAVSSQRLGGCSTAGVSTCLGRNCTGDQEQVFPCPDPCEGQFVMGPWHKKLVRSFCLHGLQLAVKPTQRQLFCILTNYNTSNLSPDKFWSYGHGHGPPSLRHPSMYGMKLGLAHCAIPGEWLRAPMSRASTVLSVE